MQEDIQINLQNDKTLLSAKAASKRLKCAPDYVTKLCRQGKLEGVLVEGVWFVKISSIDEFEKTREAAKIARSQKLSQERLQESAHYKALAVQIPARSHLPVRTYAALSVGAAFLFAAVVFAGGSGVLAGGAAQSASLARVTSPFFGAVPNFSDSAAPSPSQGNFLSDFFAFLFAPHQQTVAAANAPAASTPAPAPAVAVASAPAKPATQKTTAAPAQTIIEQKTYPVIERTVVQNSGGVSQADIDAQLSALENKLRALIYANDNSAPTTNTYNGGGTIVTNAALAQRIDSLSGITITGSSISGGTITGATISGAVISPDEINGAIGVAEGGTGTTSAPSYGQLLIGNAAGGYDLIATSSLGIGLSANAGGASGQVQYNAAGALAGSSAFTFDQTSGTLAVTNASTTGLVVSSLGPSAGQCLTVDTSGMLTTTACGTGSSSFGYPFPGNATTTSLGFNGGLTASNISTVGSTTIGGTLNAVNGLVGNLIGNASTATALQTSRTINGISFNGSSDITIAAASSTLLANSNTFGGNNIFSGTNSFTGNTILASATSTSFAVTGSSTISLLNLSNALAVSSGGTGSSTLTGLLVGNGTSGLNSATVSAPLAFSGTTLSINQASLSQNGYLSSADFTTFNNKISSTSLSATYPLAYNSGTGVFSTAFATTTANTFSQLNVFNGGATFAGATSTAFAVTGSSTINLLNLSHALAISSGGTGTTTAPTYGQLLVGNIFGGYDLVSTSSLGIVSTGGSSAFPFSPATFGATASNATSTLIGFTNGLYALGSSTILGLTTVNATTTNLTATNATFSSILSDASGTTTVTGNLVPSADNVYSLGSASNEWKEVYIGAHSLFVNGEEVIQTDNSKNVIVSAATNENLELQTLGNSNLILQPSVSGLLQIEGGIQVAEPGNSLTTTNSSALPVPFGIAAGNITISGSSITNSLLNSGIAITPNGTGNTYVTAGNFGIGTTSPTNKLEVNGNSYLGGNLTVTGNTSAQQATTTNLAITNTPSALLKTLANGAVVAAVPGTDYQAAGNYATFGYLFPNNATSTLLSFSSGLQSLASSTIGNGTQTGGLTISGGATTTGNALFNGVAKFSSTVIFANTTSCIGSQALQTDATGALTCGTIASGGASSGGGWTTNNVGLVALSTTTDLVAVGATSSPYAKLSIVSGATGTTTLALVPASGATANILDIYNNSGVLTNVINAQGNLGLGTTSPFAKLSIVGNVYVNGNATTSNLAITNVTGVLLKTDANGNVEPALAGADYQAAGNYATFGYLFPNNATSTQLAFNGGATFAGATTTAFAVNGSTTISSILNVGGALNANGGVVGNLTGNASTATALQTGRTINGVTFDGTTNITIFAASSTLLANANTFSGSNTFTSTINGSITGNAGTATVLQTGRAINGVSFNGSSDITIFAASSTLLSNSNTFSGANAFTGNVTLANATSSTFAITGVTSSLLKTLSNGAVVAAAAGVDYATPGTIAGAFPFTPTTFGATAANATSTLIGFTNGLYATASSTFTSNLNVGGTLQANALSLTTALAVSSGGTGSSTLTGILVGNGTSGLNSATVSAPLAFSGTTLSINQASLSQNGYLSSTDFTTFNNKISSTSLSATYPLSYNSGTGVFTTAFGTTTANTFSALNTFNGGVAANTLSVTGSASIASTTLTGNTLLANATTTSFAISNVTSSLLKTLSNGAVVAAVANVDYATPSLLTAAFDFTPTTNYGALANSTSTPIFFQAGLQASSTSHFADADFLTARFAYATTTNLGVTGSSTIGGPLTALGGATLGTVKLSGLSNAILFANSASQIISTTTVAVNFGGTGSTTLTGILNGNGTGAVTSLVVGSGLTFDGTTLATNGAGITAIGPLGQTQTGGTQIFATSTSGTDFTITASGNTQTFNLPFASLTSNGKLAASDFTAFSNKISSTSLSGASVISYNPGSGVITTQGGTFGAGDYIFPSNTQINGTSTVLNLALFGSTATSSFSQNGTLTLAQALGIASGGTNNTSYSTNSLLYFDGTKIAATSSGPLYVGALTATTSTATSTLRGGLAVANSLFVLQNGNIGIGNSTPSKMLDITGTARVSGAFTLSANSSCNGGQALQTDSQGTVNCGTVSFIGITTAGGWSTDSVGHVTLATTTDQVGIGATSTPYAKLAIISGGAATTTLALLPASGATANILDIYDPAGNLTSVITSANSFGIGTTSPSAKLSVNGGGLFNGNLSAANITATGTLTTGGNVGIGTTSPTSLLSIAGGNITQTAAGNPTIATTVPEAGSGHALASYIAGHYDYVADYQGGLRIYDISNPARPSFAGSNSSYVGSPFARSVAVAGRYAYVADENAGLVIFDVSKASAPVAVGSFPVSGGAYSVAVSGGYAFVNDFSNHAVRIIDVSNPAAPTLASTFTSPAGVSGAPLAVTVQGKYLYIADYAPAIYIVDISNPVSPALAGTYSGATVNAPNDIYVSGKYAYVADGSKGLFILNVANPASPSVVGTYPSGGSANYAGVKVAGAYAYVADQGDQTTNVIDVSAPAAPALVGSIASAGNPNSIALSGKYAYTSTAAGGFDVVDINGASLPAATIGSLAFSEGDVADNLNVGGDIYANGGLSVGLSGIFNRGSFAVLGTSTLNAPLLVNASTTVNGALTSLTANIFASTTLLGNTLLGNATTTNFFATLASTTNLTISSVQGSLLKTNASGTVVAAVAGTDYITPASLAASTVFPFTPTTFGSTNANATSTLIGFTNGLYALASSTIGDGSATGGLTVSGNATTSGVAYFANRIGIGTPAPLSNVQLHIFSSTGNAAARIESALSSGLARVQLVNDAGKIISYSVNGSATANTNLTNIPSSGLIQSTGAGGLVLNSADAAGQILFSAGGITNANEWMRITSTGNVGIGTTSPFVRFAVNGAGFFGGDVTANNITATATLQALNILATGSTTLQNFTAANATTSQATTTNLAITGISSSLLKTLSNGAVVAAVAGTDYLTSATTFAYPFPNNATSTQLAFNGGATFAGATTTAFAVNGSTTISSILNVGGALNANGGVVGNLTGNASTATALQTGRTINGVTFDGTSNITLFAASSTLLANSNTFSGSNTFTQTINGNISGNAATVTTNANLTGVVTSTGNATSFGSFTSATLASALSDETGSGAAVFGTNASLTGTTLASTTFTGNVYANGATTTNLAITNTANTLLKTLSNGAVVAAVAGTDYLTSATTFGYPFPSNATTTQIAFNGGLTASNITTSASTTIGGQFNAVNGATLGSATVGGTLTLGGLSNALLYVNGSGAVAASTSVSVNYLAGILPVANGGTGSSTLSGILIGNGTSPVNTLTIGSGLTLSGTTLSNAIGYPFPGNATSTSIAFNGGLTASTLSVTGQTTLANASTTNLSANTVAFGATGTTTVSSNGLLTTPALTIGSLNGLLKATSGVVSAATAGTDYENPLAFVYPLVRTANSISLAFGTTTANTFSQLQIFNGGLTASSATTSALAVNGSTTLSSILNVGGALNANGGITASNITNNGVSANQIIYTNNGKQEVSVATTSITAGSGISYSGTFGALVGGTSGTLSVSGLSGSNFANAGANTVLANATGGSAAPTFVATSTFFGTGAGGQVLAWNNGVPQWIASTTYASGAGISTAFSGGQLTITNTGVTSLAATYPLQTTGGSTPTLSLAFGTTTQNFWSNYNNFSSLFAINASSTNATTTNLSAALASTTNLTISSIISGNLLKTTTAGSVIAAVAGTDYVTGAGLTAAFPFTPGTNFGVTSNSTSTLLSFNAGFAASSTAQLSNINAYGAFNFATTSVRTLAQLNGNNFLIAATSSTDGLLAFGFQAGQALTPTTTSAGNSIFGYQALLNATSSRFNAAFGYQALKSANDYSAYDNAAFGYKALTANTIGNNNSAIGFESLVSNTTGVGNNAQGAQSLFFDTIGGFNNAVGLNAGFGITDGSNNVAIGNSALAAQFTPTAGLNSNVAIGANAGASVTTGASNNIFIGTAAGNGLGGGSSNIILGTGVDVPNSAGNQQLNIGNLIFGNNVYNGGPNSSAPVANALIGIGSSSPFAELSLQAVNGSTNRTLFAIGSSTQSATSTLFSVSNTGQLLFTNGSAAAPGIAAIGNPNTGFNIAGNTIHFVSNGIDNWSLDNGSIFGSSNGSGIQILSSTPSATSPNIVPNRSSGNTGIGASVAGNLSFITNALDRLEITNGGNVGIGTSSPTNALTVSGSQDITGNLTLDPQTANAASFINLVGRSSGVPSTASITTSFTGSLELTGFGMSFNTSGAYNPAVGGSDYNFIGGVAIGSSNFLTGVFGTAPNGLIVQGKTGIGTSSPFAKFSVQANNGDTSTTLFAIGSSTQSATTTLFSVSNTGTTYFAGNVGIGSTSPMTPLVINEGATGGIWIQGVAGKNSGNADFSLQSADGAGSWDFATENTTGRFTFYDNLNNKNPFYIEPNAPNSSFYIKSTGNVGIGTSNPGALFTVNGTASSTNVIASALGASAGQCVTVTSTGQLATQSCSSGSSAFPFTPGTSFGVNVNATSTPIAFNAGVFASSTSHFAFADFGELGFATTSGLLATLNGSNFITASSTTFNTSFGQGAFNTTASGVQNSAFGYNALTSLTTGVNNNAFGVNALLLNTTGINNQAFGPGALSHNLTGSENVGIGVNALINATSTSGNIAIGDSALGGVGSNISGSSNIAIGVSALTNITTGSLNVGIGSNALLNNSSGFGNFALGNNAMINNTTGSNNVGIGVSALINNTIGNNSVAIGENAGLNNITGNSNTAIGTFAFQNATSTSDNTAIGLFALQGNNSTGATISGVNNVAVGELALTNFITSSNATALGFQSLLNARTGDNSTAVGSLALQIASSSQENTAIGFLALGGNSSGVTVNGQQNVAVGNQALQSYSTGSLNTALGYAAGISVSTGSDNVLLGAAPTNRNLTTGSQNVLIGYDLNLPSATANGQLNIQNIIFGTSNTNTGSSISTGSVGVGTTSPFARFAIQANNGDTNTTLFAIGSSTSSTNTTLFSVLNNGTINTSLGSGLVKSANGTLSLATAGVDYANFSYPFPAGATSSLVAFNGGLTTTGATSTGTFAVTSSTTLASTLNVGGTLNANGTVTITGLTAGQPLYLNAAKQLTASSTLSVNIGGTGLTSVAQGAIVIGSSNTTGALTTVAAVAAGSVLVSNGTNAAPVYSATPSITTSLTVPTVLGGTAAASTLTVKSTSGTGAGDAIIFQVGTNGGTEGGRFVDGGLLGLGTTTPRFKLQIATSTGPQLALSDGSISSSAWTFRSTGGNLYIGTSSPSTFATSTTAALTILGTSGNVGLGTSTPFARLAIHAIGGDTNTVLFAIGSSTASFATSTLFTISNTGLITGQNFSLTSGTTTGSLAVTASTTIGAAFNSVSSNLLGSTTLLGNSLFSFATTTNLAITGTANTLLKTLSNGAVVPAIAGTDYAAANVAFPFTPTTFGSTAANATSTLIGFTGGLYALASSTIGNGNQNGGLTILGGATTTGNAYFASNLGIGTNAPVNTLDIVNSANGASANAGFGLLVVPSIGSIASAQVLTFNAATSTYLPSASFSTASGIINTQLAADTKVVNLSGLTLGSLTGTARNLITANGSSVTLSGSPVYNNTVGGGFQNNLSVNGINALVSVTPTNTAGSKNFFSSAAGNFTNSSSITGASTFAPNTFGVEAQNSSTLNSSGSQAYAGYFNDNATASTTYGVFISDITSSATGNQTFGLRIDGPGTTNASDYSFYSSGTAPSYFAGNVGVGTTTPGSIFAVNNVANFTTSTSTFYGTGGINISGGCYAVNGTCLATSGSGITSIGPAGQTTAGPAVTFATTTSSANGITSSLTITGSGSTLTFTPSQSGTLTVAGGGTGQTSFTAGQLLYGNGSNALSGVATSSLAVSSTFSYSGTLGALVGGAGGTLSISNNGLTLAMFPTIAANTIIGNLTGGTATPTAFATSSLFAGTAGQVDYFSGTGALVGTSSLFISTAGNVGIGTTTPVGSLEVSGNTNGILKQRIVNWNNGASAFADLQFVNDTGVVGGIFTNSSGNSNYGGTNSFNIDQVTNNALTLSTSDTVRLTVTGGGNVGIGTTSPTNVLTVEKDQAVNNTRLDVLNYNAAAAAGFGLGNDSGINAALLLNGSGFASYGGVNSLNLIQVKNAPLTLSTNNTPQLTVTGAGNVGIGTTTAALFAGTSNKVLAIEGSSNPILAISNTTANKQWGEYVNSSGNFNIAFDPTTLQDRGTFAQGGNFGLSSTTPWARLSLDTSNLAAGVPEFAIGSSTRTDLVINQNGFAGFGSTSPQSPFVIAYNQSVTGAAILKVVNTGTGNAAGITLDGTNTGNNNLGFSRNGVSKAVATYDSRGFFAMTNLVYSASDFGFRLGDDGSLAFVDPNNGNADRFHVTAAGNVGIGTSSPTSLLTVAGASAPTLKIDFTNTNSNGALNFSQNSTLGASIFLDGSTAAAQAFQSALALEANGPIVFGNLTGTEFGRFTTAGNWGLSSSSPWARDSVDTSNLAAGVPEFAVGSSTRTDFVIDQAGRVGIGTSNPFGLASNAGLLNVVGSTTATFTASTNPQSRIRIDNLDSTTNDFATLGFGTVDTSGPSSVATAATINAIFTSHAAGAVSTDLAFVAKGAGTLREIMRIVGATASVGIGTTSPGVQLAVETGGAAYGLTVQSTSGANPTAIAIGSGGIQAFTNDAVAGAGLAKLALNPSGGNVGVGTSSPEATFTVVGSICAARSAGVQTATCTNTAGEVDAHSSNLTGGFDVAETYPTNDGSLVAGDIVAFDAVNPTYVSRAASQSNFLGVVSSAPALTLGEVSSSTRAIAMVGRVPVKVNLEGGPIAVGDPITISSVPGVGTRATTTAQTIGIALEPYNSSGTGSITVFIKPELSIAAPDVTSLSHVGSLLSAAKVDASGNLVLGTGATSTVTINAGTLAFTAASTTVSIGNSFWSIATSTATDTLPIISISAPASSTPTVSINGNLYLNGQDISNVASTSATTTPTALVSGPFGAATDALKSAISSTLSALQNITKLGVRQLGAAVYATVGTFNNVFTQTLTATDINADTVNANKLCLGTTCVTESQLQQLLNGGAGNAQASGGSGGNSTSTPPTITVNGANPATINVGDTYTDLGATAKDNQGTDLSVHTFVNGVFESAVTIDTSSVATDTIEYVATDTWGNTATSSRTVILAQ